MLSYKQIYLDTNQWIHLREVEMGRKTPVIYQELYKLLNDLIARKIIICPISYSVFIEMIRQNDLETRKATASTIDKFARGCCIQPPHELIRIEIIHCIQTLISPSIKIHPINQLIWTKVAFLMGDIYPTITNLQIAEIRDIQKRIIESLWECNVETIVSCLTDYHPYPEDLDAHAEKLTQFKAKHEKEFSNFQELFLIEVSGVLDVYSEMISSATEYLVRDQGYTGEVNPAERLEAGKKFKNLIYNAFKMNRVSKELPGIHIMAGLHAAVRYEQKRKYKRGDCEDFRHAVCALPYYDYFCTDGSLKNLICTKPLEYDKFYNTKVLCDDEEILAELYILAKN